MTTRNLFSLKRTIFSLLFSFILLFSAVPIGAQAEEPARLHLVATVFPAYDFARVVAGDAAEVTLLLPPGADAHSYEPTPQDMIAIQNADLFLYTGGESDSWLERVAGLTGRRRAGDLCHGGLRDPAERGAFSKHGAGARPR